LPYFGVFITKNILESTWSAKEIDFALDKRKELYGFIYINTFDLLLEDVNSLQIKFNPGKRDEIFRK
jgi:hypothetical protein